MHLGEDDLEAPDNLNQHDIESGKLPTQPSVIELNSLSAGQTSINTVALLHVRDVLSGVYFLVDTRSWQSPKVKSRQCWSWGSFSD